jgi:nitrite reductase (NO-forming)
MYMKYLLPVIVLIVLAAGGYWWYTMSYPAPSGSATNVPVTTAAPDATTSPATGADTSTGTTKSLTVSASEFAFTPSTLTVNKGDTVTVTFTNAGKYPHNFTVSDLNVASKTIQPGESDTVTFTADKAGSFQYICSVPTHKDKGMVGTLTVQ